MKAISSELALIEIHSLVVQRHFSLFACWWRNAQLHVHHGVQILYRLFAIFQRYS